jgi:hypothetical protein
MAQLIGVGDGLGDGDGNGEGDGDGAIDGRGVGDEAVEGDGEGPQPGHGGANADEPPPLPHAEIAKATAAHSASENAYFACRALKSSVFIVPLRREASRIRQIGKEKPKRYQSHGRDGLLLLARYRYF